MRFGVTIFATDTSMPLVDLARAAEDRGFDSIWIPEHTHIPTSRRTPPPTGDAELAEEYKRSVDPLVALAAAASVTSTIALGTGVMLPAQRDPLVTAKAVATLQNIAGGRFELGIGFGWNVDEMQDHGVEYRTRRAHAREHVLAMQTLWHDEVASFSGDHVSFPPTWSWPKPEEPVPVLIGGGAGPKMFAHIAEYGDGWIPIGGAGLAESIPTLRAGVRRCRPRPRRGCASSRSGPTRAPTKLAHFARIGVTECVFRLPSAPAEVVLPMLDEQARLIAR